ncbi:hypothetical protein [Streptomyces mirabilis]|uniref:hypothetical protein n=1 Tax=Streptomyces mirabilis TaxID=68239 RepID=UPI0036DA7C4C
MDDRLTERDARLTRFAKRHPQASADVANALAKVRYLRGEPSEHTCTDCRATAAEWQLVDLSEREGPEFLLYSDDVQAYWPFCSLCALSVEDERRRKLDKIWGR